MRFFKTREEKIIELKAKIRAWEETYGTVNEPIPAYYIDDYKELKAKLYELISTPAK